MHAYILAYNKMRTRKRHRQIQRLLKMTQDYKHMKTRRVTSYKHLRTLRSRQDYRETRTNKGTCCTEHLGDINSKEQIRHMNIAEHDVTMDGIKLRIIVGNRPLEGLLVKIKLDSNIDLITTTVADYVACCREKCNNILQNTMTSMICKDIKPSSSFIFVKTISIFLFDISSVFACSRTPSIWWIYSRPEVL